MKQLSKSDIVKLNKEIEFFGVSDFFGKKERVVLNDVDGFRVVLNEKKPLFFYDGNQIVPTLKLLLERQLLKQVVVDMGAVKFVTSGADVMRPGIVEADSEIAENELVVVVDETHKKPLCVARSLFSGEVLLEKKEGKVLKNLHFIGDKLWNEKF